MLDDYPAGPYSNAEVIGFAKQLRRYFGVDNETRLDVVELVQRPKIWTVYGEKELKFEIWPDDKMGRSSGRTVYTSGGVIIAVRRSVRHGAYMGIGHHRNTFAHELGHAVMHDGAPKDRRADGNVTYKSIKPFESAEHHAKVFAPAFLINEDVAQQITSAEEISITFGISLRSAEIYFEQIRQLRDRDQAAHRVREMADEFIRSQRSSQKGVTFLDDPCNVCGKRNYFPSATSLCAKAATTSSTDTKMEIRSAEDRYYRLLQPIHDCTRSSR